MRGKILTRYLLTGASPVFLNGPINIKFSGCCYSDWSIIVHYISCNVRLSHHKHVYNSHL